MDKKTCDICKKKSTGCMEYEDGSTICSECINDGALIKHICVCGDPECRAGN